MEKEENKIQEIKGTTKCSSACFCGVSECDDKDSNGVFSNDLIPIDLTREILIKLPAKSIVRFRCVSKLWLSITTQPDFINSFSIRQSLVPPQSLLLIFENKGWTKKTLCMLPFNENATSYSDVNNFHITPPTKDCSYDYYYTSTNGLTSITNKSEIIIWNPTMKEHITLPNPKISKTILSFLGYDPTEDTYKILTLTPSHKPEEKYENPQILTLGSQESWREAKNTPDHIPRSSGYCIDGIVYYTAAVSFEESDLINFGTPEEFSPSYRERLLSWRLKRIIMSFDVRSEQFKPIKIPNPAYRLSDFLMSYKGRLAWVCSSSDFIIIWVLQDAEKQEWSENVFVIPLPERDLLMGGRLNGATSIGEFIYLPGKRLFKEICAFYYDPVRETIRCVRGLDYEKFRRCYGSNNDEVFSINCYPDYVESLVSLKKIMCG